MLKEKLRAVQNSLPLKKIDLSVFTLYKDINIGITKEVRETSQNWEKINKLLKKILCTWQDHK